MFLLHMINQRIIASAGTGAQQLFFRMSAMAENLRRRLPLLEMK